MSPHQAAIQREKERVCCEAQGGNRSTILLADSFSGSPAAYRSSPTHTLVPKALPFFFSSSLSLSHTVPDQSLPCRHTPTPQHTHTQAHMHTGSQINHVIFCTSPQLLCFHMGQMPACVLANAYFGVYDDRVNRVTACFHQIFGDSIKINH